MTPTESKILFTYGTFRPDDRGSPRGLPSHRKMGLGWVPGKMFNVGSFPGAVPSQEHVIVGALMDYRDLDDDEWESQIHTFDGIEGHPNMFRRELVPVWRQRQSEITAWIYWYQRDTSHLERIEAGNWLSAEE